MYSAIGLLCRLWQTEDIWDGKWLTKKTQREKIPVWLKYGAYKGSISIKMSFGADCGVFHWDSLQESNWLLDLLRHGVADLTGSNMPGRKEKKNSKGEGSLNTSFCCGGYSGVQVLALNVFWTDVRLPRRQLVFL